MLFDSFEFIVFFFVVTFLFFLLPYKSRWLHLLIASCYFYMSYVPVYIVILFGIIIVDYVAGICIDKATGKQRTLFLNLSLITNIAILCVFKYYNFFIENANSVIHFWATDVSIPLASILLPIGISFHTFQSMSYTIEVYKGRYKAEKHFGIYALYVMFYPQLLAGPIERPQALIHQFYEHKKFESSRIIIGLKIMLWGLIKKIVIADRLALYVNAVYAHTDTVGSLNLILVNFLFFPFQIYCDFSGYTSIAIGAAKVMGFDMSENFRRPFLSSTLSEFWTRWHITLFAWFRDYLFNPIAKYFRKYGRWAIVAGLGITFLASGIWHGAGWNFVMFGVFQAVIVIGEYLLGVKAVKLAKTRLGKITGIITTYLLISFSLAFFRASSLRQAIDIIKRIFLKNDFRYSRIPEFAEFSYFLSFLFIVSLIVFEYFQLDKKLLYRSYAIEKEVVLTVAMLFILFAFGINYLLPFIYFQF